MHNKELTGWFSIVAVAVFTAFIWFGCGGGGGSGDYSGNYTSISLVWPDRQGQSSDRSLQAIPSDVSSILLQVSASDMATIEATIDPLVGQVTLTVPDGSNRKFQVWAYPANSPPNYYGTTTMDVFGNVNVIIQMFSSVPPDAIPETFVTFDETWKWISIEDPFDNIWYSVETDGYTDFNSDRTWTQLSYTVSLVWEAYTFYDVPGTEIYSNGTYSATSSAISLYDESGKLIEWSYSISGDIVTIFNRRTWLNQETGETRYCDCKFQRQ